MYTWLTCCIKLKCIAGHPKQAFVPLPGSAFAFLVVLHLPAALELSRAVSGLDLEACSYYDALASLLKATLGINMWPQTLICAVNRSWGKTWETPRGFQETYPRTPPPPPKKKKTTHIRCAAWAHQTMCQSVTLFSGMNDELSTPMCWWFLSAIKDRHVPQKVP